ncbi:MAG: helix-turn-helix domain-containing protein [Clostridia bacterium]|nr:helix-turn-helix domain-containing protein [Clostridia bacterium]
MNFNEILKEVRKDCGMTQKDVYQRLQVSPNCYASWEQGRTQPDIESIKKLCAIFDVSADYLLGIDKTQ